MKAIPLVNNLLMYSFRCTSLQKDYLPLLNAGLLRRHFTDWPVQTVLFQSCTAAEQTTNRCYFVKITKLRAHTVPIDARTW